MRKRASLYVCLCAATAIHASAQSYSRKILAKSGDSIRGKTLTGVGQPTLNDKGQVVFIASSEGLAGVFTSDRLL